MKPRIAKECEVWYDKEKYRSEVIDMESAEKIRILREKTGLSRKDFSIHIGMNSSENDRGLGSRAQETAGIYSTAD